MNEIKSQNNFSNINFSNLMAPTPPAFTHRRGPFGAPGPRGEGAFGALGPMGAVGMISKLFRMECFSDGVSGR